MFSSVRKLGTLPEVDELVALMTPERFYGVGEWYEDFSQTSDAEVTDLLERARLWTASAQLRSRRPSRRRWLIRWSIPRTTRESMKGV